MAKDVILSADLGGTPLSPDELAAVPALSGIRKEIWGKFPGAIARKEFAPGEVIFRQGENGTTAFLLLEGAVEISLNRMLLAPVERRERSRESGIGSLLRYLKGTPARTANGRTRTHIPVDGAVDLPVDNPIGRVEAGELFGELSALAALKQDRLKRAKFYPRPATARAATPVTVLEMLPNILNNVLYNAPAFKEKLNTNYRTRALDTHLRSVPAFQSLSGEFLDHLRSRVDLVDYQPGQVIFQQGDPSNAFYLIRLGFVKVSQQFAGGEMVLAYLSRGSYFGEMGILPAGVRVRATGLEKGQASDVLVYDEAVQCGRAPKGAAVLSTPWDSAISRSHFEMQVEGDKLRVAQLASGKNPLIYKDQARTSFVAGAGEQFRVGDTTFEVLGDTASQGVRNTTVTAMDYVQCVLIKREDFLEMLDRFPDVRSEVVQVARARRRADLNTVNRVQLVSLESFLDQELMQGQNLLLMDLDRCTRCDECVQACIKTHDDGVSRLFRDGLRFDRYLVATACRACLDPLCMTQCPVGSIRRKETLDIVIEDWCIGCGNCGRDCPYGAINIVPLTGRAEDGSIAVAPKATVCDLCAEYDEPNCVRACPHDAAIRIEPKTFFARDLSGVRLTATIAGTEALTGRQALERTQLQSGLMSLAGLVPRVEVRNGPKAGSTLPLKHPETVFGRANECDYLFTAQEGVSRRHCRIFSREGKFIIQDLGSANGTYVNGEPVTERELSDGDTLLLGQVEAVFLAGQVQ
ncbi:MAG: cyclic nucleotide-binding domain-containing protein [Bryobacteraceae bacterium]|nr:cyclic nucleotide-binding domain-containing protein [Bryobacteraceae bacterium]